MNQNFNVDNTKKEKITIVSIEELETTFYQMRKEKLSELNKLGLNEYDTYINSIRQKRSPGNTELYIEKHHILPRFEGGDNATFNNVAFS
jgi:hypothetical protein